MKVRNQALRLLAFFYNAIVRIRNLLFDLNFLKSYKSPLRVISVGNLSAGGSGKSIVVRYLADLLIQRGEKPVIVLRGYRSVRKGVRRVGAFDQVDHVGDEALCHYRYFGEKVPVIVSPRRVRAAKYIEAQGLGDVILLDDGFQHRALSRDVDLVLVDRYQFPNTNILFASKLLPLGLIREPVIPALKRAGALASVFRCAEDRALKAESFDIPQVPETFSLIIEPTNFVDVVTNDKLPLDYFIGEKVVAVAAIGIPQQFFQMLTRLNITLKDKHVFPDHHFYKDHEWDKVSNHEGTLVITTEKDAVKLNNFVTKPGKLFYLEVNARPLKEYDKELLLKVIDNHHVHKV